MSDAIGGSTSDGITMSEHVPIRATNQEPRRSDDRAVNWTTQADESGQRTMRLAALEELPEHTPHGGVRR